MAPHRFRRFKPSNDPLFAAKLRDIVGFKSTRRRMPSRSRSTALDRTQPGLPMKKGRLGTQDDKRNSTTTLFAARDILEGKVIGRCMQRHRH